MGYRVAEGVRNRDSFFVENVVRKRQTFHISEMTERLDSFMNAVQALGLHPNDTLFYSLNNTPYDENVDIEFFLPVKETYVESDEFIFSSYFEMNNMILTTVDNNYETLTEVAYARLLWTLEANNKEIKTPFYHILPIDGSGQGIVFLGYAY